jgi:hypothetical protein
MANLNGFSMQKIISRNFVPLKRKSMEEVAQAISSMFHLFGPPQILQHDNGGEFVGMLILVFGIFCNCRKGNTNQCKEKKTCVCLKRGLKCRSDCHKGKVVCDLAEGRGRKRPHLDPGDSSDDLGDFESSPNTLLEKQKQRELKRQKIANMYPFRTVANR